MAAPPIGIMPRNIWRDKVTSERVNALLDAMERYADAGKSVPLEWLKELRELLDSAA